VRGWDTRGVQLLLGSDFPILVVARSDVEAFVSAERVWRGPERFTPNGVAALSCTLLTLYLFTVGKNPSERTE
jgi:hypothetical protein